MSPFERVLVLLLHGISALFLLGAITHQALASWWPARGQGAAWWHSLRAVHPERYVRAVIVLFVSTLLLGSIDYAPFRFVTRHQYLDANVPWATGLFEIKEHRADIGLAL